MNYCNESKSKYEYKHFCYNKCPSNTHKIENEFLCLDYTPEGYYLDKTHSIYKKCFDTCKTCLKGGNKENNNCLECKSDYIHTNGSKYNIIFELDLNEYKNCYIKCPHYFYFDNYFQKYYCTKDDKCPGNYNKLIYDKNQCYKKCGEDGLHKYEFQNGCYKECPKGSIKDENKKGANKYFCKPNCTKDNPYEIISTQECVQNCSFQELTSKNCILNYINKINEEENIVKALDSILQNFEKGFTSEEYNTSTIENGEDEIYEYEKTIITFTTTENQKNNGNNNMTSIDLGECEDLLRKKYNISDDEVLYMKKIDVIQEGMKIPKIEYDIYSKLSGNKLVKLNLTICSNSKISISIPIILSESLEKLNSSSDYYNDICYSASSDNGAYISLKDRKKEFVEGNKTVCQEDCEFSEFDYNTKKAKCLCKPKESSASASVADMKIDKSKLYKNFIDINNIANFKIMKCYKVLFNKKGIIKNIASYIVIIIEIFHIIAIIIFYSRQKKQLFKIIENIKCTIINSDKIIIGEGQEEVKKTNSN